MSHENSSRQSCLLLSNVSTISSAFLEPLTRGKRRYRLPSCNLARCWNFERFPSKPSKALIRPAATVFCTFYANHDIKSMLRSSAGGRGVLRCGVRTEPCQKESKSYQARCQSTLQHVRIRQERLKNTGDRAGGLVTTLLILMLKCNGGRGTADG